MTEQTKQVSAKDLPEDLQALVRILSGLELIDRVIDEGTFHGSQSEAVAQARAFLRQQHQGVIKNIKAHDQAHLILKETE